MQGSNEPNVESICSAESKVWKSRCILAMSSLALRLEPTWPSKTMWESSIITSIGFVYLGIKEELGVGAERPFGKMGQSSGPTKRSEFALWSEEGR